MPLIQLYIVKVAIFFSDGNCEWIPRVGHEYLVFVKDSGESTSSNIFYFSALEVSQLFVYLFVEVVLEGPVGKLEWVRNERFHILKVLLFFNILPDETVNEFAHMDSAIICKFGSAVAIKNPNDFSINAL